MNKKEYKELVKEKTPRENVWKNLIIAFLIGGLMGVLGQGITDIFNKLCGFGIKDSYMLTMAVLVIISSLLTGLGFFDKIVSFARAGLIVPTTGFAHAMTSAAMDYRKEGFVKGIGGNIFKLTGSIILYGLVFSFFTVLVKVIFK